LSNSTSIRAAVGNGKRLESLVPKLSLLFSLARRIPKRTPGPFFHLDAFRSTYVNPIFHPNANDKHDGPLRYEPRPEEIDSSDEEVDEDSLMPPNTCRPPGRSKKRIRSQKEVDREGNVRGRRQRCCS
jgi:hypothetical protein